MKCIGQNEDLGERPLIGLNFRMEELEGAVGLAQLAKLERMIAKMRRNSGTDTGRHRRHRAVRAS